MEIVKMKQDIICPKCDGTTEIEIPDHLLKSVGSIGLCCGWCGHRFRVIFENDFSEYKLIQDV